MMKLYPIILLLLLGTHIAASPAKAAAESEFRDIKLTPDAPPGWETRFELRPDAREAAQLLKIEPYIERLHEAKLAATPLSRPLQNMKLLSLWRIMQVAQEVRKMSANIDRELADSFIALDSLNSLKNNTTNAINSFNFMQGGILGIVKQSLVLNGDLKQSQYALITPASIGTGLSALNLLHPHLWSRKIDHDSNTLAHFLDAHHKPQDADQSYVWHFFNTPVPGSGKNLTRKEMVINHWQSLFHLNIKRESQLRRLTASPLHSEDMRESIALVNKRIALLQDLKTHVEELDASLYELHKSITSND